MKRLASLARSVQSVNLVLATVALAGTLACSDRPEDRQDGGAFMLPDATVRDTGVPADTGVVDTGPFVCPSQCPAGESCGCLDQGGTQNCGCHAPQPLGAFCDPEVAATCTASVSCVRARRAGDNVHVCSDGAEGLPCSKTEDICTTALGCVCLTQFSGATNCECTETFDPRSGLCDPMVPQTCNDTCIRVIGAGGRAYFLCSDGSAGQPCTANDGSCRTSLGCTCPIINGEPVCWCTEPSTIDGTPCDPAVSGACVAPLSCAMEGSFPDGLSTVCRGESMMMIPCDPLRPSCPPGLRCEGEQGNAWCVP